MSGSDENEVKNDKKEKNNGNVVTKESLSAVCALFSALALLMLFTGSLIFGEVGIGVTEVLLGLFGYFAYPVFLAIFYLSFTSFFGIRLVKNRKAGGLLAACILCIALLIHTATTAFRWDLQSYLGNCFVSGGDFSTSTLCGLIGGLPVSLFCLLLTSVGALVVFSVGALFCGYLFVFLLRNKTDGQTKGWLFGGKKKQKSDQQPVDEQQETVAIPAYGQPYGQTQSDYPAYGQTASPSAPAYPQAPTYGQAETAYTEAPSAGYTQQPYVAPRPAVSLQPMQMPSQSGWNTQSSYSPFGGDGQGSIDPSRPISREESKAFLFGGSPAESYRKNLFFDQTANVNNRPSTGESGTIGSYTHAYQDSFRSDPAPMPEKIVTDYTAQTPSYTHPSVESSSADVPLVHRPSEFIRDERRAEETPAVRETPRFVEDRTAPSVLDEDSYRISDPADEYPRRDRRDELSRGRTDDFSRDIRIEDFSDGETRRDRNTHSLFEEEKGDEITFDAPRGADGERGTFVSPFAERDFSDDTSTDFGRDRKLSLFDDDKSEDDFSLTDRLSERDDFTVGRKADGWKTEGTRFSQESSSRFATPATAPVPETEKPQTPMPAAPPVVEKSKVIRPYSAPPLHYFDCTEVKPDCNQQEVEWNKEMILATLAGFGIKEATISTVTYGPTVTRYNVVTPINVSSKKILGLAEQFAVNLHAEHGVNVSYNYGDGATSIEVPNRKRQFVNLGCMLTGAGYVSAKANSLTFTLGVDVSNEKVYGDVAKMTHLLVAGASGMGKSAFLRSLIISLIYKYSPEDLRLILIDPKMADFTLYTGIPHLVINEIVCRPQQAVQSLRWAIGEMERRYELFRQKSLAGTYVVNLDGYNSNLKTGETKLPKIVIIVDELADLMSVARKEVEDCIQRLTAKARAAGIHMILATQRPSVDVVTGVIKSNLPTRIAFSVSSEIDSRVILDTGGAEKLLSMGDMMYSMAGFKTPVRVQAPYIDDAPAQAIINYIRDNNDTDFNAEATAYINNASAPTGSSGAASSGGEVEAVYIDALKFVIQSGSASISMIQRKCSVGFNKAGKIIEWMEEMHYISEFDGSPKARKVLITKEEFEQQYGEF